MSKKQFSNPRVLPIALEHSDATISKGITFYKEYRIITVGRYEEKKKQEI